jgi:hypothetical protein
VLEPPVEDRVSVVGAGTLASIPKGTLHTFRNAGTTPARSSGMFSPVSFERFHALLSESGDRGVPLLRAWGLPAVDPQKVANYVYFALRPRAVCGMFEPSGERS